MNNIFLESRIKGMREILCKRQAFKDKKQNEIDSSKCGGCGEELDNEYEVEEGYCSSCR